MKRISKKPQQRLQIAKRTTTVRVRSSLLVPRNQAQRAHTRTTNHTHIPVLEYIHTSHTRARARTHAGTHARIVHRGGQTTLHPLLAWFNALSSSVCSRFRYQSGKGGVRADGRSVVACLLVRGLPPSLPASLPLCFAQRSTYLLVCMYLGRDENSVSWGPWPLCTRLPTRIPSSSTIQCH